MPGENTLAYFTSSSATKEKSFITLTPDAVDAVDISGGFFGAQQFSPVRVDRKAEQNFRWDV